MNPPIDNPVSFPYTHHFSEEDIHELLGAMGDHQDHPAQCVTVAERSASPRGDVSTSSTCSNPGPTDDATADARAHARSERKRSREKQRRSDVNKQFADLTQLLKRIEIEDLEDGERMSSGVTGPANRVDLIVRTIAVLERMHEMNRRKKNEIAGLKKEVADVTKMAEDTAARLKEATLYQQGPSKPIMMMVPMMVSPDSVQGAAAGGNTGYQMAHHFMPQAAYCPMPPMAASGSSGGASHQAPMMSSQMPMGFPQMMFAPPPQPPSNQQQSPPQHLTQVPSGGASGVGPQMGSQPQQSPTQSGQKQASSKNGVGNLAHCA